MRRTILGLEGLQATCYARNATAIRLDAEHRMNPQWPHLAGYVHDPSVFEDRHVDILTYSSARNILTFGAQHDRKNAENGGDLQLNVGGQIILR